MCLTFVVEEVIISYAINKQQVNIADSRDKVHAF